MKRFIPHRIYNKNTSKPIICLSKKWNTIIKYLEKSKRKCLWYWLSNELLGRTSTAWAVKAKNMIHQNSSELKTVTL